MDPFIIGLILSTALGMYQSEEQKRAVNQAEQKRRKAQMEAEASAKEMFKATKPADEAATLGLDMSKAKSSQIGLEQFLVPSMSKAAGVGTSGKSGLGFYV